MTLQERFDEAIKGSIEQARCGDAAASAATSRSNSAEVAAAVASARAALATAYALQAVAAAIVLGCGDVEVALSESAKRLGDVANAIDAAGGAR